MNLIELNATEYRAFVSAGQLLAEMGHKNMLEGLEKFPLVSQKTIDGMKTALVIFASERAGMLEDQRHRHNNLCEDVKHLAVLKN